LGSGSNLYGQLRKLAEEKSGENLMAGRSHSTFKKRQKELARVEKQRDKAEKRQQAGTKETGGRKSCPWKKPGRCGSRTHLLKTLRPT
jgi:hypothetical protein